MEDNLEMINFAIFNLQFHGHYSYFRNDFQLLLAVKDGQM